MNDLAHHPLVISKFVYEAILEQEIVLFTFGTVHQLKKFYELAKSQPLEESGYSFAVRKTYALPGEIAEFGAALHQAISELSNSNPEAGAHRS